MGTNHEFGVTFFFFNKLSTRSSWYQHDVYLQWLSALLAPLLATLGQGERLEVKELWEECSVGVDVGGGPIIFLSEKVGV